LEYWVLQGFRLHWAWSLVDYICKISGYDDEHLIWGFNDKRWYNKVEVGDIVYFRANRNGRDSHGVFGRGKIVEKFEDSTNYWPSEYKREKYKEKNKYPYRIKIGNVKILKPLRDFIKNSCSNFNPELYREDPLKFFEQLEKIDIFRDNLVRVSYGRGSLIHLTEDKLRDLDSRLSSASIVSIYTSKDEKKSLEEKTTDASLLKIFFSSKGYYFPEYVISSFYTALKTKGFVILSGLSGTGKTKLALKFVELLGDENYIFLSVRPDWRDSKPLIGYYNPLSDRGYEVTALLKFIMEAKRNYEQNKEKAKPYFIILDEMNLAHVEYYFADFLSVLESGRDESGFTKESIKLHNVNEIVEKSEIPKEIKLPPNLYIIGTVNVDETTYMFSPKVLDRAFTIEFNEVDFSSYLKLKYESLNEDYISALSRVVKEDLSKDGKFIAITKSDIKEALDAFRESGYIKYIEDLNRILSPYDLHFGYRVLDEISLFFKNAKESMEKGIIRFKSDDEIVDLAILMKVLPKFHGPRRKLERPLLSIINLTLKKSINVSTRKTEEFRREILRNITGKDIENLEEALEEILYNWGVYIKKFRFPYTAKKCLRMLRQLYETGFASFS